MALRIASIIVPIKDNSGKEMAALHKNIEAWLCTAFGGFTAQLCIGAWVDDGKRYDDENVRYDVHYHDRSDQGGWVKDIAHQIMANSDQKAVYVIMSGSPQTIKRRAIPKLTAAQIKAHNNARDQFNLDKQSLLRAINRAEGLRPATGGRSGANDAVLGLRISIGHIDEAIGRIDKLLADDRKNA